MVDVAVVKEIKVVVASRKQKAVFRAAIELKMGSDAVAQVKMH